MNTEWEFKKKQNRRYPGKEKPICNNFTEAEKKYICSNKILDSTWF